MCALVHCLLTTTTLKLHLGCCVGRCRIGNMRWKALINFGARNARGATLEKEHNAEIRHIFWFAATSGSTNCHVSPLPTAQCVPQQHKSCGDEVQREDPKCVTPCQGLRI